MAMKLAGKEEMVFNHVERVHRSVMEGKEIPALPKGMKLNDLPATVRSLYELKAGKISGEEFTEILKV